MKRKLIVGFLMYVMAMVFVSVAFPQSAKADETWLITYQIKLGGNVVEENSLVITFTKAAPDIRFEAAQRLGYKYSQSGGYWTSIKTPNLRKPFRMLYILSTVKL